MLEDMVRTISMDSTDGLERGADVVSTEINSNACWKRYGRLFNVMGDAIDGMENFKKGDKGYQFTKHLPLIAFYFN